MKKGIFILTLILLIKPILPVLDYIINYDYIIAELCENKEKPQLQCNGKCHLMKELAEASEDDKPLSQKKQLQHETEILFIENFTDFQLTVNASLTVGKNITGYSNLYSHLKATAIFHPPVLLS